jgi:NADPH:quinone reductase-like Zn-dependent oxidoreductase
VAAGLTVVTTASPKNHKLVKSIGAKYAFDHNDPNVIDSILNVLKPGDVVLDCIGYGNVQQLCARIVSKLGGGKFSTVRWPEAYEYDNVQGELGMWTSD